LVRGDCGFSNEPFIAHLEERGQPYLFKLRQSAGVKKLISRKISTNIALTRKVGGPDKAKDVQAWEYAMLVTNSDYPLQAFGQLYRDRAHCENGFDELKNQWGWGGFTTQDGVPCSIVCRILKPTSLSPTISGRHRHHRRLDGCLSRCHKASWG
jgi:Transposase DDE domain